MMVLNSHGMKSKVMREVIERCRELATSKKPVLIIGEFGSGKGWIARIIHEFSERKDKTFSKLNCNSMQADEIERKLFGFLSFNGDQSVEINRGLFEKCNDGTIFFEGFEAMPVHLKQQIIQSVQKQSINHIGSSLQIRTDVRMIASINGYTTPNKSNGFHQNGNSIYEINPHIIFLPPLRNRREDIIPLIYNFKETSFSDIPGDLEISEISPKVLYLCIHYNWPGNIRQLKNAIKLATLLADGRTVKPEHLPESISIGQPQGKKLLEIQQSKSFQVAEKNLLRELLNKLNSPELLAEKLELEPKSIEEKIRHYQLDKVQIQN